MNNFMVEIIEIRGKLAQMHSISKQFKKLQSHHSFTERTEMFSKIIFICIETKNS